MGFEIFYKIIVVIILLIMLGWFINKDREYIRKHKNKHKHDVKKSKYSLQALTWKIPFPELDPYMNYGIKTPNINKTSIAISGGGTRSFSASIGYFRALQRMNLTNYQYVSTVSGGSWFYGLYAFSNRVNIDKLLGKSLKPNEMTLKNLKNANVQNKEFMGHVFSGKDILEFLLEELLSPNSQIDLAWNNAIGKMLLEPYKLNMEKPIAISKEHADNILKHNPRLGKPLVQLDKSFWICNTTLCNPKFPHVVIPLTPLYCGIHQKIYNNSMIGGTLIENYAFGNGFTTIDNFIDVTHVHTNKIKTLRDMLGTSSTAYASMLYKPKNKDNFIKYVLPQDVELLIPKYTIDDHECKLADGAFSDSSGILSLVARGVKHIISFINTNFATDIDSSIYCDTTILPLFGLLNKDCYLETLAGNSVQIFKSSDYYTYILPQFLKTHKMGGPTFARQKLQVLKNELNGVGGDYSVDLLIIILQTSSNFLKLLPEETRKEITHVPITALKRHRGTLNDFPNYEVAFQNLDKGMLYYTLPQINILSSYTDWCLQQPELKKHVFEMLEK